MELNWINAEEQKPDNGQLVLVYQKGFGGFELMNYENGSWVSKRTVTANCKDGGYAKIVIETKDYCADVTYWMPIPNLPTE